MNDFEIFVLCLSGFYFLNCSSAKHSAYDSAGNTFDHDKDTLNEYRESVVELEKKMEDLEQQRWGLQNQVKNVHSLPKLVEDRARIEEMEKEVRRLKDAYAEDEKRESKNYRDEIETIEESITRQDSLLLSEATYILTQQKTVKANEEAFNNSLIDLNTARDFVSAFSVIGCGTNEHESNHSNLLFEVR